MAQHSPARSKAHAQSPFVQVCDRCRWKKIKCDGQRPCGNCKRVNLPCETRARLSKHSTPRSYVQYLEERIRQLENKRDTAWSPQASDSRNSPYGEARLRRSISLTSSEQPKKKSLPDWTVLRELGAHVIDEDGFTRYMGPSSGVGFAAKVLQEIMDDDQPADKEYYSLFSIDDFSRSRALATSDHLLSTAMPTKLPDRAMAEKVLEDFFNFTERTFPILHRPTFMKVVDDLYALQSIGTDWFELLAQFYFTLSIGHCFNHKVTFEDRTANQIRYLQTGVRCFYTTLHTRRDGLTRLQTVTLQSYALVLLRQRSEAMRISAMANTKALECGLHHDGVAFTGNPLETEMRRRVFWCVFTLHLYNSSIEGLPRALHEADITVSEPTDVDDEQLSTTEIRNTIPGRTKIHRFISVCRLARILSRVLDVLYSHNKRKQASTRIEQMNRLCCEHLLEQLDYSFEETPDDIPPADTEDPAEIAILASYANEQIFISLQTAALELIPHSHRYHYIRWLIHRPALALSRSDPQFSSSLQIATEAASELLRVAYTYRRAWPFMLANPAVHPFTAFIAALTPLYRTTLLRAMPGSIPAMGYSSEADYEACHHAMTTLAEASHDHSDTVRRRVLQDLVMRVFSGDHEELQRMDTIASTTEAEYSSLGYNSEAQSSGMAAQEAAAAAGYHPSMDYHEHQVEHFTAHEDLHSLVHEAFSPGMTSWNPSADFQFGRGF